MFKNLKIRTKLLSSSFLILIIFVVAGVIVINNNKQSTQSVVQISEVEIAELKGIETARINLEILRRSMGEIIVGEDRLEDFEASVQGFIESMGLAIRSSKISKILDSRESKAEVSKFESALEDFGPIRAESERIVSLALQEEANSSVSPEGEEESEAEEAYEAIDPLFETLAERLKIIDEEVQEEIAENLEGITVTTHRSQNAIIFSLISSIITGVLIALVTALSIAKSVSQARNAAVEIARGNMDVEIDTSGKDEIAELSQAIDQMRRSLKVVMEEYERKIN